MQHATDLSITFKFRNFSYKTLRLCEISDQYKRDVMQGSGILCVNGYSENKSAYLIRVSIKFSACGRTTLLLHELCT
jgi:hypothetical protein